MIGPQLNPEGAFGSEVQTTLRSSNPPRRIQRFTPWLVPERLTLSFCIASISGVTSRRREDACRASPENEGCVGLLGSAERRERDEARRMARSSTVLKTCDLCFCTSRRRASCTGRVRIGGGSALGELTERGNKIMSLFDGWDMCVLERILFAGSERSGCGEVYGLRDRERIRTVWMYTWAVNGGGEAGIEANGGAREVRDERGELSLLDERSEDPDDRFRTYGRTGGDRDLVSSSSAE